MQFPGDDDDAWLHEAFERLRTTQSPALRDEIIERTHWLALRGARRFASRGEPFDDLLQVARIGLLKAVDRFDVTMGVPFGAYATPTIMGELRRHFRDHTWSLHVPRRAKDLRPAVNDAVESLTKELGRSPQMSEIAAELQTSEEAVIEAMEANNAYRSFTLDAVGSGEAAAPPAELDGVIDRATVLGLLSTLGQRERTILYLRFYEELSQSQIAERVGTSQVHVGRLITSSLKVLRDTVEHGAIAVDEDEPLE
jgi:RNA polymerase sigma-B factor